MPKHWTPEQRKAASERAKARIAMQSATAVAERPAETESEQQPDSENVMAQLASLFTQAASERSGRDKAMTEAIDLLSQLDPFKYPEIADNPVVQAFVEKVQQQRLQSADVPPGTIIGTGMTAFKKPWTNADLLKGKGLSIEEARRRGVMEWVEYRPMKNFDVTWNGIRIVWPARRLGYFPKCHVDVFEASLEADVWNERHAAYLFGNPDEKGDADMFSPTAARIRAMDESKGEYYKPGGGLIALEPSTDLVEAVEEGAA